MSLLVEDQVVSAILEVKPVGTIARPFKPLFGGGKLARQPMSLDVEKVVLYR